MIICLPTQQHMICDLSLPFVSQTHIVVLDIRETELIEQLDQLSRGKLEDLAAQRDRIEATLGGCLQGDVKRESLKLEGEAVAIPLQPEILKPNTEANIVFLASEDTTAVCQKYGQVIEATSADPSKCRATSKGIKVAGKKSVAILQVFDSEDKSPSTIL